jgi:hypothetical protein
MAPAALLGICGCTEAGPMPQKDNQEALDTPKLQCNSNSASSRHTVIEKGTLDRTPAVHKLVGVRSDRPSPEQGISCAAL